MMLSVEFPRSGWSTSLAKLPMFIRVEMNNHVVKFGKSIANKDDHTDSNGLIKARRFLDDGYLEDVECTSDKTICLLQ